MKPLDGRINKKQRNEFGFFFI